MGIPEQAEVLSPTENLHDSVLLVPVVLIQSSGNSGSFIYDELYKNIGKLHWGISLDTEVAFSQQIQFFLKKHSGDLYQTPT